MPATTGAPRRATGAAVASAPPPGFRGRRVFPGQERELAELRRWLSVLLPEGSPRDDVTSVATELASNAIKHTASGRGGWFAVEVALAHPAPAVRVSVADGGAPEGPRMVDDPLAEHGRGLMLVQGLSARTGVSGDQRGRVVWADIAWAAAASPAAPAPDPYEAAIRARQAELASQFAGVPIWFGRATMQWWALVVRAGTSRLVTAPSPEELATELVRAFSAPVPLRAAADAMASVRYHRDRRPGMVTPVRTRAHRVAARGTAPRPARPGEAPVPMARRAS